MDYKELDDNELINLLYIKEDRLPRAAVDECIRRGNRMVKPLADIVSKSYIWTTQQKKSWAVVHAAFILGAISTEDTVLPLLKSLRYATAYDIDWVTSALPSIFRSVGLKAKEGLKKITVDETSDWYTRAVAIESLAAITLSHPEADREIFDFLGAVFADENVEREVRQGIGHVLFGFQRKEFRGALMAFGKEERELYEKDISHDIEFDEHEVEEAFSSSEKDIGFYGNNWLSFYNEDEIEMRQKRWSEEEEEDLESAWNLI